MKSRSGFTIVELLIVIVVIAILAAISIVAYNGMQDRVKYTQKLNDVKQLQKLVELYNAKYGTYPVSTSWGYGRTSGSGFIPGLVPEFTTSLPQVTDGPNSSAMNNTYIYRSTANGSDYKIMRLYQPSIPAGEGNYVPTEMRDQNSSYVDRWGVWSAGGSSL